MHIHSLNNWRHEHLFTGGDQKTAERRTLLVIVLTGAMMVVEITCGTLYGSMALVADGWHMASHAAALGITVFAYYYANRHAHDSRYTFGTGKVGVLGGFTSAVVLAIVALLMALESAQRLLEPRAISFDEAILVAVVGLAVNLISARMLHHSHGHGPDADHNHHHHQDHNLRAAYLHVLADALTSVLAIVALLTGKYFNWVWMDPMMGIVGAVVIGRWCYGLFRDTGRILLDGDVDEEEAVAIQQTIEVDADNRVTDLHVWRVGPGHFAVIVSVVTHFPKPPEYYKKLLAGRVELVHVTVEVHACSSDPCLPVQSSA